MHNERTILESDRDQDQDRILVEDSAGDPVVEDPDLGDDQTSEPTSEEGRSSTAGSSHGSLD